MSYYQPRRQEAARLESMPSDAKLPVVVVGAGPIGMAVALGLAQRGIEVTILEAGTAVSFGSRAICISRHSQEIAGRLGFGDALAERALPWVSGRSFFRDRQVLRFQMPNDAHAVRPPMVNISQSEFEEIVLDAVEANPLISLYWGCELTGIEHDAEGATLRVSTVDGECTLRAGWVVAADGARSRTRELLGLRLQGNAYEGRYVIADIHWKSGLPTERMVWFDPPSNPGSTVVMHRQPDDIWRIDYQLAPEADAEEENTEEAIRSRITRHLEWLKNDVPWTLEWRGYYKALALTLDEFVHGRVIFAGDAAHLVPIFGVRGLNSGMEDAETLAWTLAAVIVGDAEESLLTAYAIERRDAWQQNVASANKSTLIMTPGTEGYRITRDALLGLAASIPEYAHLIDPRQSSATHARRSPLTMASGAGDSVDSDGKPDLAAPPVALQCGDPLEDRRLVIEGKETSLHELRGVGFGIYAVAPVDAAAVEQIRTRIHACLPHEQVTAIVLEPGRDGGAAAAWAAAAGEVVVVRPDGLVLARGTASDLAARGFEALATGSADISRPDAPDPVTLTAEQQAREDVWLRLSEALDHSDDKRGLLARLALALAFDAGPARLATLLDTVG